MTDRERADPLVDALREGDPDDPRYRPLGRAITGAHEATRSRAGRAAWAGVRALAAGVLLLALLLAMPMLMAGPPDLLDRVRLEDELRVVVRSDAPQVVLGVGSPEGFDVDVANAVARLLEVRPIVTAADATVIATGGWGSRWHVAFDVGVVPSAGSDALRLGAPYSTRAGAVVVTAGSGMNGPGDLVGRRACVVADGPGDRWTQGALGVGAEAAEPVPQGLITERAPTLAACLDRLRGGDVDAVVVDWEMEVEPLPAGLRRLTDAPFRVPASPSVLADSPDATSLLRAVDAAIETLRVEGTLRELSERRFGGRDLTDRSP